MMISTKGRYALRVMARNNLAAFLSVDDGKTWSAPLLLDERELVSYPDAQKES